MRVPGKIHLHTNLGLLICAQNNDNITLGPVYGGLKYFYDLCVYYYMIHRFRDTASAVRAPFRQIASNTLVCETLSIELLSLYSILYRARL